MVLEESMIIPNFDDTLLYAKGTLLGEEFEVMTSLFTGAGNVISSILSADGRTMMKLAAL